MKTIPAEILASERARESMAKTTLRAEKHHLSFASFAAASNSQVRSDLALTAIPRITGTGAYVVYRTLSGALYIRVMDSANASDYGLGVSGVTAITGSVAIRPGLMTDSFGVSLIYDCIASGAGFQVRASSLLSANDPVGLVWQNYGPSGWGGGKNTIDALVTGFTDTAAIIRRVEAVCPCEGGVIVAVGTHILADNRSTVRFFWVTSDFVVALNTMIQCAYLESYAGWQFASPHTSYICIAYDAAARKISVIATDTASGHAITFSVQNGIESEARSLAYVSAESTDIKLIPYTVSVINGLYYLTAGWTRYTTVGQTKVLLSTFDCYLTSSDGVLWSVGELSSFICQGHLHGALIARSDTLDKVYYVGISGGYSAPATRPFSPNAPPGVTVLDDYAVNWAATFGTGQAGSIDAELVSPALAEGAVPYAADTNVSESSVLYLGAGYDGITTPVGVYGIDSANIEISAESGISNTKIKGRDLASWKLIEYAAPLAFDMPSRVTVDVTRDGWRGLKRMTPDVGVKLTQAGTLIYKGLNDPYIALTETSETGDVMLKTRVRVVGESTVCLGSVGFVFGMNQEGQGNIMFVPRQCSWTGGKIPQGPSMTKLVLTPIDSSQPDKAGTGWNFKARVNPLWRSVSIVEPITVSLAGTWRVNLNFYMVAGKTYELAFILRGRRAQLYAKEYNNTSALFSQAATYTLIAEYLFDANQQRSQYGRDYAGLALCTDTFVDVDTFAGGVEKDLEAGITNAREISSSLVNYDDWAYVDSGVVKAVEAGGKTIVNNPGAVKLARLIRGRAMISTADNTAVFMRRVKTDGLRHYLQEGDANSGFGFPGVNPLPVGSTNYGGSDPQSWRIILHHGFLFAGNASVYGIPESGDMIVDDEIFSYAPATLNRRAGQGVQNWTEIPTWYWVLEAASEGSSRLAMWWNGATEVGDNTRAVAMEGMLAEILSQNGKTKNDTQQFYVTGHTVVASPAQGSTNSVDILPVYEAEIRNIAAGAGDIACFSGRGKYQTIKTVHASDAPVCYFPRDSASLNDPVSFVVERFASYSGAYQCTEDLVRKVCAVAGMRTAVFNTRMSLNTPITLSNTARQQLPLITPLANFVLDGLIWIPGNSTNGAGVGGIVAGSGRFEVYFRNHYIVSVQTYAQASDLAGGCAGIVRCGLKLRSGEIATDGAGETWLEVATIPISDYGLAGLMVHGAGDVWTCQADVTRRTGFRLSVQNNLVCVELGGSVLWTFNLDDYVTVGGVSLRFDEAAEIDVAYTVAPSMYTTMFTVRELSEEVERFTFANGASGSSAIASIANSRKFTWRPRADGGLLFTRFEKRDNAGTLTENLWRETSAREGLIQRNHRMVRGRAAGEALDTSEIALRGYRYGATNSDAVTTVEAAAFEAALTMKQEAGQSLITGIDAIGMLEIEPEDTLALDYAPIPTDIHHHARTTHIVNAMTLRASISGAPIIEGSYTLRRLIGGE